MAAKLKIAPWIQLLASGLFVSQRGGSRSESVYKVLKVVTEVVESIV